MMKWADLLLRLRAITRRGHMEKDLQDESGFHIEMETRKNLAAGMNEVEAARHARIHFGGESRVAEECRDTRRTLLLETIWVDLRYAVRILIKNFSFTSLCVLTLALGIGATSTILSWINGTLLNPIPGAQRTQEIVSLTRGDLSVSPTAPYS